MHFIQCNVFFSLHSRFNSISLPLYALYSIHFMLCIIFFLLYSMHCIDVQVWCNPYIAFHALFCMHCSPWRLLLLDPQKLHNSSHITMAILLGSNYSSHIITFTWQLIDNLISTNYEKNIFALYEVFTSVAHQGGKHIIKVIHFDKNLLID